MEIKPFKKINGNGYSFREIWKIYDEQFNILRDIILSLGDKYQVENFSGSDDKVITLNTPYNSNQLFVYCNGVLQWKDRDYRENSPTEIELLFDRKATDDVRVVTIKSNVIKSDLHQYLKDISSVVANAKEHYDSARNLESRLVELYSSLQQTHSLYTNNSTTSLVADLTRLKSEYEKVNTSVTALDKKLKDLIGSSEYVLTTLNIDELKELVKNIKSKIDDLSRDKTLDIIFPLFGGQQMVNDSTFAVGDCIFVGIDKKYWFLIDTFSETDDTYASIRRAMQENKITKFEFLLITHWHGDHYGNAIKLMRDGLVGKVYAQNVPLDYPNGVPGAYGMPKEALLWIYNKHLEASKKYNVVFEKSPVGDVDFHGANLYFHNNNDYWIKKHNSSWVGGDYNNTSTGLTVSYIGRNFVTQGDAPINAMAGLASTLPANIDLLKSNHHSICDVPWVFKKLNPKDVIITANQFQKVTATRFDFATTFYNSGSNIYYLTDQTKDIHITYSSSNDSVSYNKELVEGYIDNCSGWHYASNSVTVNINFNGDIYTGDIGSPYKYIADAVRKAHINGAKEIRLRLFPGDYTKDIRNYNFFRVVDGSMGLLQLIGFSGKLIVEGIRPNSSDVIYLPPVSVSDCDCVEFKNITFKTGIDVTGKALESENLYSNVGIYRSNVTFNNCTFIINDTKLITTMKSKSDFMTYHVDSSKSVVTVDSCTFSGEVKYGIRSVDGSVVTVVGSNTVDDSVATMYYAVDGDINVNGTATKNTSNEATAGGKVSFLDVNTTPTYPNTTRGQVIGTRLSQKYGGKLGYISDGNGGHASIDHFNKSGDLNNKPDFEGQFAYDKTNRRLGFALGSSNKSDWLDLTSNKSIGGVKEWKQGGTYSYGDLISNSYGNLFYYRGGDISYRSGTSVDSQISGALSVVSPLGGRFVNIDPNNHAHTSFAMLHSKPENFPLPSTNSEISKLGTFVTYYTKKDTFKNQPTQYGQLINLPPGIDDTNETMQLWIEQFSGQMYTRGGNYQNPIADRKFTQVYPNDFDNVDVLLFDYVSSDGDARARNVRLRKTFNNYKVITFYLTQDNDTTYLYPCKFDVSEYRMALKLAKRATPAPKSYIIGKMGIYWSLKFEDWVLGSDNLADMTHSENCKIMAITGWPRQFDLD
nr:MAG TPA: ComA-like protein [Bacteriophage sp.]